MTRKGDDFEFHWPDGLEVEVRDLHQSKDGPRAEVRFGSKLVGHLHQAMLNLMSSNSRDTFRRTLDRRDKEVDWQAAIEQICVISVQLWREGDPFMKATPKLRDPEQDHLIRPLLPVNVTTLLFGDGGSGKSQLMQMCAAALSRGSGLAGMWSAGPLKVGYLDWETDEMDFADRMARLGIDGEDVWYKRLYAPLYESARQIKRECDILGLDVCIYDSLGFAAGGELKDADVVLRCFSAIRYIGRGGGLVHHIPKESKEPYGSVYVRNATRNAWFITKAGSDEAGFNSVLIHRKSNNSKQMDSIGVRFTFEAERTTIERTDAKPLLLQSNEGSLADRALELLKQLERDVPVSELAAGLEMPEEKVSVALSRLKKKGQALNVARGTWRYNLS